jgi:hypothetical protein
VTRATAELSSFHGVGRKKLLAWPATKVQSGGGIVDTGNQQAAVDWPSLEGVWIQSSLDRKALSFLIAFFSLGFRASRALIQAMY